MIESDKVSRDVSRQVFISVIIPTYHDWGRLRLCLGALEEQAFEKHNFEIIVVNNDPDDPMPDSLIVPSNCWVISEKAPGSYAARNAGAARAVGGVFAFTDADCLPGKEWLKEIAECYRNHSGIVSGRVRMFSKTGRKRLNFAESYDYIFGINQELYAMRKTAATANLCVDRESFLRLQGFDAKLFSGGDIDFCVRAREAGVPFLYNENSVVQHPLRSDFNELVTKARRLTGGKIRMNKIKGVLIALAPPLVRLHILFAKKRAPVYVKTKCFAVLFGIKLSQIVEAFKVILGGKGERC